MRLIDVDHFKKRLAERINELETNPLYTDGEKEVAWEIDMFVLKLMEEETITKKTK